MSETQDVIEVMARGMWPRAWVEGAELPQSQREYMRYASLALSALASAGYRLAGPGECVVREDVVKFLRGEAPLEGIWWGDRPMNKRPYWWRAMLSASQQKEETS